jgi:hypothetical protein
MLTPALRRAFGCHTIKFWTTCLDQHLESSKQLNPFLVPQRLWDAAVGVSKGRPRDWNQRYAPSQLGYLKGLATPSPSASGGLSEEDEMNQVCRRSTPDGCCWDSYQLR